MTVASPLKLLIVTFRRTLRRRMRRQRVPRQGINTAGEGDRKNIEIADEAYRTKTGRAGVSTRSRG
jgi:hypothetical protein